MKIVISADMEGTTGVVEWIHVQPPDHATPIGSSSAEYGWARLTMTREVNAAIEGAMAGGADLTKEAGRILGPVTFHWIETADHGYKPLKSSGRTAADVLAEVAEVATDWVRVLPG